MNSDALVAASASALPEGITDLSYRPPPGRLGNLTVIQQHALEKMKKELAAEGHYFEAEPRMNDATMLRFLRARKFDVPKAKQMFIAAEKWRKDFGVDDIVKNFDFPELNLVDKYYPQYYHKIDKDGRPVYVERLGQLDLKALYGVTTQERQLKRLVLEYEKFLSERLPACSAAAGHPVETSCTILDLHNVSLSNFYRVKDYVMQTASIGQNYYPECMGKFYIINAPFLFSTVWGFIKPWLDEVTVAKIDIIGSSYKDKLLAQIDADNLPKIFGGNCSCPGGCSLSDAGPWNTTVDSGGEILSA
ncbi:CRAL-TRIO domain-containing protein [Mycena pura]|uniref:CRAL-TRIO domain-containing protein n=1 Tax=Mycena pura TaxID=153505 RepID=A0AAD6VQE9_9AGAR|nr:CRAL-TRIO domain-containing protein [Mycena pura]